MQICNFSKKKFKGSSLHFKLQRARQKRVYSYAFCVVQRNTSLNIRLPTQKRYKFMAIMLFVFSGGLSAFLVLYYLPPWQQVFVQILHKDVSVNCLDMFSY